MNINLGKLGKIELNTGLQVNFIDTNGISVQFQPTEHAIDRVRVLLSEYKTREMETDLPDYGATWIITHLDDASEVTVMFETRKSRRDVTVTLISPRLQQYLPLFEELCGACVMEGKDETPE